MLSIKNSKHRYRNCNAINGPNQYLSEIITKNNVNPTGLAQEMLKVRKSALPVVFRCFKNASQNLSNRSSA